MKEDNGRLVPRIYGTGTICWQNSALDQWTCYDVKLSAMFLPNVAAKKTLKEIKFLKSFLNFLKNVSHRECLQCFLHFKCLREGVNSKYYVNSYTLLKVPEKNY